MKKIKKKFEFEILSKGQKTQVKGGNAGSYCACCICDPAVKGAGDATATRQG